MLYIFFSILLPLAFFEELKNAVRARTPRTLPILSSFFVLIESISSGTTLNKPPVILHLAIRRLELSHFLLIAMMHSESWHSSLVLELLQIF